jgi:hypothetical protein
MTRQVAPLQGVGAPMFNNFGLMTPEMLQQQKQQQCDAQLAGAANAGPTPFNSAGRLIGLGLGKAIGNAVDSHYGRVDPQMQAAQNNDAMLHQIFQDAGGDPVQALQIAAQKGIPGAQQQWAQIQQQQATLEKTQQETANIPVDNARADAALKAQQDNVDRERKQNTWHVISDTSKGIKKVNDLGDVKIESVPENAAHNPPSGYRWTANGQLEFIPGGPADPNGSAGGAGGSRAQQMFNRVVSSGNEAAAALQNIAELPITASSGWFGSASPGSGLLSSTKGVLAQKMSSQDVQDTKVMLAGVTRALGAIETSGLQVNGSLIKSMENVTLGEGDTNMTKLRKMAEIRQIVERGLEVNLTNPKIPEEQKGLVRSIIAQVQAAVPYTHHDITMLQQSKNPKMTINDFAKKSGLPTTPNSGGTQPAIGNEINYADMK